MRKLIVVLLVSACASPFKRIVDEAKTIEDARGMLGLYRVRATKYQGGNEAWNFEQNECVLFTDGKKRFTSISVKSINGVPVAPDQQPRVLCTPSEADAHERETAAALARLDAGTPP